MTRCQYCKMLTHSEDLIVYIKREEIDKVIELQSLKGWIPCYMYNGKPQDLGKFKCGDIWIHFRQILTDVDLE